MLENTHDQNTGPLDAIRGKRVWRVVGSLWEAPLLPDELKRSSAQALSCIHLQFVQLIQYNFLNQ
jgi:hypothetical protein